MRTLTWEELSEQEYALTFDDVTFAPVFSTIDSRFATVLKSKITHETEVDIPIISSNMDTITESDLAIAIQRLGGFGIIHRFMTIEREVEEVRKVKTLFDLVGATIGVNDDYRERAEAIIDAGANIIAVDIAHGHCRAMINTIKWVKERNPYIQIIAGNVATAEAVEDLADAGADAVKVGVGPGSMCTTRIVTGAGVPQLTAISACSKAGRKRGIPIIADGGMRYSADVAKAFAAGANSAMSGSFFKGITEACGPINRENKKLYRGMASKSAQTDYKGKVPEGMAPEGEDDYWVPLVGKLADKNNFPVLVGGIRSSMSYLNAATFEEIHQHARFVIQTPAGVIEGHAHGKK